MFGVQNTPGEHQVFISYSSVNKSVADAICGRLESVYAFYYAEQYEACFFMSASGVQSGNDVFIRMTVTDRQGKVLAVSDDIQLPNIPFSSMMEVQDGFVELICIADEAIFRRDTTVVWSAAYSEDGQGNLVFEDN